MGRPLSILLLSSIAVWASTFEGSYGGLAGYDYEQKLVETEEACPDYASYSTYAQ